MLVELPTIFTDYHTLLRSNFDLLLLLYDGNFFKIYFDAGKKSFADYWVIILFVSACFIQSRCCFSNHQRTVLF